MQSETWWEGMETLEIFAYDTVALVHFTDQNGIPKTIYCTRWVMVCKIGFTNWNANIAVLHASMVVTYYIKLFRTGSDRHNGILMSLLLLVAETINTLIWKGMSNIYYWEKLTFSKLQFSRKENLKKCANFGEQNGTSIFQGTFILVLLSSPLLRLQNRVSDLF